MSKDDRFIPTDFDIEPAQWERDINAALEASDAPHGQKMGFLFHAFLLEYGRAKRAGEVPDEMSVADVVNELGTISRAVHSQNQEAPDE